MVARIINKKVRNATKVSYDNHVFRSKLEFYCYKKLKENNIPFEYESLTFTLLPPFTYPNDSWEVNKRKKPRVLENKQKVRGITYTPDFTNEKHKWIIECKGNPNDAFPLRWKLFKHYMASNNLKYDLYMPTSQKQVDQVIELIKNR